MTASLIFSGRRSARSEGGLPVDGTEGGLLAAVAVGDAGLSAVADFWTAVTSGLTGSPMGNSIAEECQAPFTFFPEQSRRWRSEVSGKTTEGRRLNRGLAAWEPGR